ncbi:MAG: DHH family phosphoesterase [bacterium]|nr:DHH family phosphoesterase [bacterium]
MDLVNDIKKIKERIEQSKDVIVVTHDAPTFDSIGSTLSLYLGLLGLGKKVSVVCPESMTVGFSHFVGVNKLTRELSNKNFVISLDYAEGSIEKVSYNIEGDKFNLVVEPRPGFEPFSSDKVHYSYAGTTGDLIFVVDTIHLGKLGTLYESHKDLFGSASVINVDSHSENTQFGSINIVDPAASSTSEMVARIMAGTGMRLTTDVAVNLLNAMYQATDNFTSARVTPQAFELAAACLKAGGKRFEESLPSEEVPIGESVGESKPEGLITPTKEAPADWLKPKIFKSSQVS